MSCPICAKTPVPQYRPFCSRRCADIDLGKWLTESYVLPGDAPVDGEEETEAFPEQQRPLH